MRFVLFGLLITLYGCYSLSGISIDPNVNFFYVEQFKNNADNIVPGLEITFTENLKNKIFQESRLKYNDTSPDIEFKGTVVDYRITSEAPQPGEIAAINRLTINLAIEYVNNQDEKKGWKKNFSHFFDFDSSTDLASIQDEAIQVINDQLMEDIFNASFTDW